MNLYRLLAQLDDHCSPLCIVQDDAERQQTYQTILRALDQRNPLAVRSHHPAAIEMTHGGVLRILTAAEALAERGGLAACLIPAGTFWLGRDDGPDDERPMRQRHSPAFWMMTHPVTVGLYDLAVQSGALIPPGSPTGGISWDDQLRSPTCPVVWISLDEAEHFAAWLGRLTGQAWRVPTEAEWEYAARGTDQRLYPWGDADEPWRANVADQFAEADDDDSDDSPPTHLEAVGCRPGDVSPLGIADLAGNVSEWTCTVYARYDADAAAAHSSSDIMVARGGSYDAALSPLTYRDMVLRSARRSTLGFRLVRSW